MCCSVLVADPGGDELEPVQPLLRSFIVKHTGHAHACYAARIGFYKTVCDILYGRSFFGETIME